MNIMPDVVDAQLRLQFLGRDVMLPSSDEHQLQWTRNILSREYHASALTGSMRLRTI
jgi:hypothetical protein